MLSNFGNITNKKHIKITLVSGLKHLAGVLSPQKVAYEVWDPFQGPSVCFKAV